MTLSRNIAANLLSRFWVGALQFLFAPIYLKLLGPDAYGLVGFYTTLLVSLLFLDQAMGPVLSREFARLGARAEAAAEMRNLLRSLESLSLCTALLVGGAIALAAPLIARDWIKPGSLPGHEVVTAVRLIGLAIACQWPSNFYLGGFIGLHRQDLATRLRILVLTVQWTGAALLLWLVEPRIEVLLITQAAGFLLLGGLMRRELWRLLPRAATPARFAPAALRSVWRFAGGNLMIGLTASLLTQSDKLMVSKFASLDQFAAYSLSFTLASLISILISQPIGSVLMPLFARQMSDGDQPALLRDYHRWTQIIAMLALPLTGCLVAFDRPLIDLWLGSGSPLHGVIVTLLPWVALGMLVNTLMVVPFLLQIAAGWTRLTTGHNLVALALILPALVVGVPRFGPAAGAWCWLALGLSYYLIMIPLMHRRILPTEMWAWWGRDTLLPGGVTAAIFALSAALAPQHEAHWPGTLQAAATALVAALALVVILPYPRAMAKDLWRRAGLKSFSILG